MRNTDEQNLEGLISFRIQTDRRQRDTLPVGAVDRRGTGTSTASRGRADDVAESTDDARRPPWDNLLH